MNDKTLHDSTHRLILEIERKDRRFRFAQTVFMVLLMAGFIAGGYFGAKAYQEEQSARAASTENVIKTINTKLNEQSRQLKCIVEFFTIEDRANLTIKSVDDCFSVERSADLAPNTVVGLGGSPSTNFIQAPVSEPTNRFSTPPPRNVQGPAPPPPSQAPPANPPTEPPTPAPRPIEVLGIPVCVPVLDLCITQ